MTDTHETVRLAEKCESLASIEDAWSPDTYREAATLLRRIPELEAERDQLRAELEKVRANKTNDPSKSG